MRLCTKHSIQETMQLFCFKILTSKYHIIMLFLYFIFYLCFSACRFCLGSEFYIKLVLKVLYSEGRNTAEKWHRVRRDLF